MSNLRTKLMIGFGTYQSLGILIRKKKEEENITYLKILK